MENRKELLGYCGLYCGDCPAYTGEIADAATTMLDMLAKYRVDLVADSILPKELNDYATFRKTLEFMGKARCDAICRNRDNKTTSCGIRKCCREKGYFGCHECDDFEDCEHIKTFMKGFHADACVKNLQAIREMGVETWIEKGNRLWFL
jgi:hypothetical protein